MNQTDDKREIAIQISGVKKQYRLGQIGGGTLQADLQSWWARLRGKEDPNLKIGQEQRLVGQTFMALNGIDLTIYKGEALGIIGKNGAGKSTLLKLLSRVTAPSAGTIDIYGRIASMLEVGTGFNGEMTGRENVYMNGAILGMTKAEIDAKMEDIIEFSEVRDFIDTPVKRYSSGMYVKLAFSVAAHLDSEIMIMDEVLAVGDMAFQKKCLDKMREAANQEGRTVLYVSHNMNTIRQLCSRCIVLEQGKIIFDGAVEDAIEIYLGAVFQSPTYIDLRDSERKQKCLDGLRLTGIEVLNYDDWRIPVGNKLQFAIHVQAEKDLDNVSYRSRLFTPEELSITVLRASNLITCKAGETLTIPLEADISALVPGQYYLTPALYDVNEYGGWDFYDHIDRAVLFEVETALGFNDNMNWQARWWGNVKFPDLIDLRKNDDTGNLQN
ncbi:MAG: ABC transporter ATP-binding protein [Aeriscardovia sp.]|nr:ABC transporter ATP-binding protein [Aeriscardovia sp.]